jgi:hypothetical protein
MKLFIIVPLMLQNYPYPYPYLIELRLELILKYSIRNFLQICYKIHKKSLNLMYRSEFGRTEKGVKARTGDLNSNTITGGRTIGL